MSVRVSLREIIDGMEWQSDEATAYLDTKTGKVVTVLQEELYAVEDGDPEGFYDPAILAIARAVSEGEEHLVELPDRFEINEYRMMERFAASVADADAAEDLLDLLRGRGAFRRFKDKVQVLGLADEWYAYRDRAYEEVAVFWCEEHEFEFERS